MALPDRNTLNHGICITILSYEYIYVVPFWTLHIVVVGRNYLIYIPDILDSYIIKQNYTFLHFQVFQYSQVKRHPNTTMVIL